MALHVHCVVGVCRLRKIGIGRQVRVQLEQMALSLVFAETLSPSAIRPTLVPCQFVECGGVLLLQLLIRGGRFTQHAVEFRHLLLGFHHATFELGGLLECSQQEALAFGQIVGKKVGVIHVADYCSDSSEQEKPSSSTFFNRRGDTFSAGVRFSGPGRPATWFSWQSSSSMPCSLFVTLGKLKCAGLQPFVPNAKPILIPEQDLDSITITIEEQEQVARQRILIEDLLSLAHQAIEAIAHLRRRHTEEDPDVGKVCHEFGAFQGRSAPTTRMTSTNTAWPIPRGSRHHTAVRQLEFNRRCFERNGQEHRRVLLRLLPSRFFSD